MRAEMRYHRAVQDLKTKQLQIHDHQKKYNEMQAKYVNLWKSLQVIPSENEQIFVYGSLTLEFHSLPNDVACL